MIDSIELSNMKKQLETFRPDFVEVMPGIMPRVMREIRSYTDMPIIAGGLLRSKGDILEAIDAGADAISTTNTELWKL